MQSWIFFLISLFFSLSSVAQALVCAKIFQTTPSVSSEKLQSILGTSNPYLKGSQRPIYETRMAETILKLVESPTDFNSALKTFAQVRVQIAKEQNRLMSSSNEKYQHNSEMIEYIEPERGTAWLRMKSREKGVASETSLRPPSDYGNSVVTMRYLPLYETLRRMDEQQMFQEPDGNEYQRTIKKLSHKKDPFEKFTTVGWIIHRIYFEAENISLPVKALKKKQLGQTDPLYATFSTQSHHLPVVMRHLQLIWKELQSNETLTTLEKKKLIAEFEWMYISANPLIRAGASIGDGLSLVLQIQAGFPIRKSFQQLDFEILPRDLQSYVDWRVQNWK